MGWATEYRQLNPGPFSSTFTILEADTWFLMEEASSRRIEIQAPAPTGMYVLALVEGDPAVANGQALTADHVFVQGPDSECRAALAAGLHVTQLSIRADQMENAVQSVAPELSFCPRSVTTTAIAAGRLVGLRRAMRAALLSPSNWQARNLREEAVSRILADLVAVLADHSELSSVKELHCASGRRTLDTAMEYIEAHLDEAIRVDSLCRCAGTSLRSLERLFAKELGVSPQQYIKARRLNSVRRHLLAEGADQGQGVTEVALCHGFTHLGRFSGDYRRHFGESPRETLQGR